MQQKAVLRKFIVINPYIKKKKEQKINNQIMPQGPRRTNQAQNYQKEGKVTEIKMEIKEIEARKQLGKKFIKLRAVF